jgi:hypothetical protein
MKGEPRVYGSRWDKARRSFLAMHPLCVMPAAGQNGAQQLLTISPRTS